MASEIERKFLVADPSCLDHAVDCRHIMQGYLSRDPQATVRIRIIDDTEAYLCIKSANHGARRGEWEYPIPVEDAREMIEQCQCTHLIDKHRYILPAEGAEGLKWEVDVYHGEHQGLLTAEIELPSEDTPFTIPSWLGAEVTGDPRYYNSNL